MKTNISDFFKTHLTNSNVRITHLEAKLLNLVIDVGAQDIPTFTIFGPIALPTDLHRLIYCQLCVYKRYPETQNVDDLACDLRVSAISNKKQGPTTLTVIVSSPSLNRTCI